MLFSSKYIMMAQYIAKLRLENTMIRKKNSFVLASKRTKEV